MTWWEEGHILLSNTNMRNVLWVFTYMPLKGPTCLFEQQAFFLNYYLNNGELSSTLSIWLILSLPDHQGGWRFLFGIYWNWKKELCNKRPGITVTRRIPLDVSTKLCTLLSNPGSPGLLLLHHTRKDFRSSAPVAAIKCSLENFPQSS